MKILFVMEKRVNAGSIQAISNYMRIGKELGHSMALYGDYDPRFPGVRFSTEVSAFNYVMFIVESRLGWLSGLRLPRILSNFPRHRRAVLDADGAYNQTIIIEGYDRNHGNELERSKWLTTLDFLADKILQPTLEPREPKVIGLPFYGYDPDSTICFEDSAPKRFDIIHLGHNWWRWRELRNSLLPAIERIRNRLDGICFVGSWWEGVPPWAHDLDLEVAFCVEEDLFQRLRVQARLPVSYNQVIRTMSEGRVNIMTQRPLLRHLRFLTSKYFEIFSANTIPLVMLDPDHAESVYGPAGRELVLHEGIAEKLINVLDQPQKYEEIVEEVRSYLLKHHSYKSRVRDLVEMLQS